MPRMIVVAGPPGGGKSTQLGPDYFLAQRIPYFNIDDRCKELHGSSKGIPVHIRNQANADLRQFCTANFTAQATFAYETTLRKPFAIEQSGLARGHGFESVLHFIAAPFEVHFQRVQARSQQGGHSASEKTLLSMYKDSMENLPKAIRAFDHSMLYDGSGSEPRLVLEITANTVERYEGPIPPWIREGLLQARDPHRLREDFER